jgi:hypothetical protein
MYIYCFYLYFLFPVISLYFFLFLFMTVYLWMEWALKHACHLQPCKVRDEWLRSFDPAAMLVLRSLWFPPQGRLVCCHAHFLLPFLCHLACHILGQFNLVSPPDKAGARLPRSDGMLHVLLPDNVFLDRRTQGQNACQTQAGPADGAFPAALERLLETRDNSFLCFFHD